MLDRNSLTDGTFLSALSSVPGIDWWTLEQIEASMQDMLSKRPAGQAVWVFAYGSLIWNPLFRSEESCLATLEGWRRSFCMRLLAGRGCTQNPGRMMSLTPGGRTEGLAMRIDESSLEQELRLIWRREMVSGSYLPYWAPVQLKDGRELQALIFSANPACPLHEEDDRIETVAPLIATAAGPLGRNEDYVFQLDAALRKHGLRDNYVATLARHLQVQR